MRRRVETSASRLGRPALGATKGRQTGKQPPCRHAATCGHTWCDCGDSVALQCEIPDAEGGEQAPHPGAKREGHHCQGGLLVRLPAVAKQLLKPVGPGAGRRVQGAGSREKGAGSREKGAGRREKGARRREQGERRREKGEGRREKGEGSRENGGGAGQQYRAAVQGSSTGQQSTRSERAAAAAGHSC